MNATYKPVRFYSKAERLSDGIVHVTGVLGALIAVPVMLVCAVGWHGDAATVTGVAIYGATLLVMLAFSALYNIFDHSAWCGVLQRLDHAGIYFKIAGTYTPFTMMASGQSAWLLPTVWGAALAGAALKLVNPSRFRWAALALYLATGWVGLFAIEAFQADFGPLVLSLILIGGGLYTVGIIFHLSERLPFHNTIWHVFVLGASGVFYAAVLVNLARAISA
jgi:hemolysin III